MPDFGTQFSRSLTSKSANASLVRNSPAVLHLSKRLAGATKRNERTRPVCCAFRTETRSSDLFIKAEHRLKAKTKARMTSPEIVPSEATVTQFPELSLHFPPSPADSTPCTRRAHPDFGDARHSWDGTYQASECHQSIRVRARSKLCGDRQNITRLRTNIDFRLLSDSQPATSFRRTD